MTAQQGGEMCPACRGAGRVVSESLRARSRRGGNISYFKSLGPSRDGATALSMSERGRRGGRPRPARHIAIAAQS